MYEVIIIGAGPAGMSAALILGRCMRKVLLIDNGKPRNAYSKALHGYLTRDGTPPSEFLTLAREELKKYQTIEVLEAEAVSARKTEMGFAVVTVDGSTHTSRRLLVATGVIDTIPNLEGIMNFYGKSVHTCPYCDAWELRGKAVAVYGKDERGYKLALSLKHWTDDLFLLTDGCELDEKMKKNLNKLNISLVEEKISALKGRNGELEKITFENGRDIERTAMFFNTDSFIRSKLLEQLGCEFSHTEGVTTGRYESTNIPGLYVAGNICRDVQLVIVAAGEGAEAAFGINTSLNNEDYSLALK